MKRRSLLRAAAGLPLAAQLRVPEVAAQTAAPVAETAPLSFEQPDEVGDGTTRFFTQVELDNLRRLGSLFYPSTTDVPGAKEAGAAEFLDFLLSQSPADRQSIYRRGLEQLEKQSRAKWSKGFSALSDVDAGALLAPLARPWTYKAASDPLELFLRTAKDDFWTATINSREYATAVSKRRRGASGTGLYWRAIE